MSKPRWKQQTKTQKCQRKANLITFTSHDNKFRVKQSVFLNENISYLRLLNKIFSVYLYGWEVRLEIVMFSLCSGSPFKVLWPFSHKCLLNQKKHTFQNYVNFGLDLSNNCA
jgi:hypothetical protein